MHFWVEQLVGLLRKAAATAAAPGAGEETEAVEGAKEPAAAAGAGLSKKREKLVVDIKHFLCPYIATLLLEVGCFKDLHHFREPLSQLRDAGCTLTKLWPLLEPGPPRRTSTRASPTRSSRSWCGHSSMVT